MSKHTPGPWSRDKYGHVVDANGNDVKFRSMCIAAAGREETIAIAEANTNLAAAAPDLLCVLQRALKHMDLSSHEARQLHELGHAVIAKATE